MEDSKQDSTSESAASERGAASGNAPATQAPTVLRAPVVAKKRRSSWVKITLLIVIPVAVMQIAAGSFVVYKVGSFVNDCNQRTASMEQAAAGLRAASEKWTVDGYKPTSLKTYPNGDCLTGSGAVLEATFPSVQKLDDANLSVATSLGITGVVQQNYTTMPNATNTAVNGALSSVTTSGLKFDVEYTYVTPVACDTVSAEGCIVGGHPIDTSVLLDRPVQTIKITTTNEIGD